ncbi:putative glucosylceramidase 4 [Homalodisca vitripennis]|uniref:putative glucosylceramidase 4 n=1 Tax=Homalodisca vitripennis TaxID=197043 RepID=UPI001EEB8F17|nr:putative glucosylceramidase 4 [Homalodisca vitripennis]
MCKKYIFSILCFMAINDIAKTDNIPCSARLEQYGYVCVCNETYCDTVERPSQLPRGQYYHYMTSEDSPGFTKTVGTFVNISDISNISSDVSIWVNSSVTYQTFSGIGAGISDSSGINFNTLSSNSKQRFIESYFGVNGIEYTFGRIPVAATDFSMRFYSYDDVPGDVDLKYFNLTEEDFTLKIPLIKMAMAASKRGLKLVATPWTPPSWMKTNNNSRIAYLYSQYHHTWTAYLLKYFEAYSENGINFWGLSQGNELILGMMVHFPMPNLAMMPDQLRSWTKYHLGPMLRASNFKDVKVITLDDERPFLPWFSNNVFSDKEAAQYIDGIALHSYFDSDSNIDYLQEFHNNYPDKFILYTENSLRGFGSKAVKLGSWDDATNYITNLFQTFNHWVVGYMDWNIVLDENGGPSEGNSTHLDSPVIINVTNGEFYKQPLFYALGHFSKFLPPGSIRVHVTTNQNISDISKEEEQFLDQILREQSDAATSPTGQPGPPGPGPTTAPSTTILALGAVNPDNSHTLIIYNPRSEQVNVTVTDERVGTFQETIPPHSLNSFVYW